MNDQSFITMLYALRRDRNISQKSMASMLGISPQYYNDLESGRRMPSVKIADAVSAVNCQLGLMPGQTALKCVYAWHWRAAKAHGWNLGKLLFLVLLLIASPVFAEEPVIQFKVSDWNKALQRIELDQQENKLLRQQNAQLKQLAMLSAEQVAKCEALQESVTELERKADAYRRILEAKNEDLRNDVIFWRTTTAGSAVIIAGLLVWIFW